MDINDLLTNNYHRGIMKTLIIFVIISAHICAQEVVSVIRYTWTNPENTVEYTITVIDGEPFINQYYPGMYNYYWRDHYYLVPRETQYRKVLRKPYYRKLRRRE